ncbi:MAG TPA: HEXXH motif-containing putative peptide modification protein [Caulobacteraceae bacterium]|jgi:hypothetical protein
MTLPDQSAVLESLIVHFAYPTTEPGLLDAGSSNPEFPSLDRVPGVLGGVDRSNWIGLPPGPQTIAALAAGLEAMGTVWPAALADVRLFCRGIVPLSRLDTENACSVSSPDTPFFIGTTVHPGNSLLQAELILHETSHLKLDILSREVDLICDDGPNSFHHPWRPDLRPLSGVLYGVHAFVAIVGLYRAALNSSWPGPDIRAALIRHETDVDMGLDVLKDNAHRLTTQGQKLLQLLLDAYGSANWRVTDSNCC